MFERECDSNCAWYRVETNECAVLIALREAIKEQSILGFRPPD